MHYVDYSLKGESSWITAKSLVTGSQVLPEETWLLEMFSLWSSFTFSQALASLLWIILCTASVKVDFWFCCDARSQSVSAVNRLAWLIDQTCHIILTVSFMACVRVESDGYVNAQMCLHLLAALRHTKWFRVMCQFIILVCYINIC